VTRLAAIERGAGPPLVLLHGLFGQARNLGSVQAELAVDHRVIALDLRNHGASPHAPGMGYGALAADVAETLDALGVARCGILGHSMGGKVAMCLALDAPERISRLLVADIAPIAYRDDGGHAAIIDALQAIPLVPGMSRAEADAALAATIGDPGLRGFLLQNLRTGPAPEWRLGLAELAAGLHDILAWPAHAARYGGPALFIAGARSAYIAAASHPAIEKYFPDARIVTLEGAGHWLHADNPAGFLALARDFLAAPLLENAS
jgi:esterase